MPVPMPLLWFVGGFVTGAVIGVGGFLFYMRYRTRKQLQAMEDQMGDLLGGGMDQDLEDFDLEKD